jgi:pyruvate/2-oxoglutarate dehydrogenase complex dihydrolipoamide dehydrogenase (E3) component
VKVTVLQKGPGILPRDEPELVAVLTQRLRDEGVDLRLNVDTTAVEVLDGKKVVVGTENGAPGRWAADDLLVGAGRAPNIENLGLEEVGVKTGRRGIEVDERMRTNIPSIYAAGDVAGRFLFTHSAGHEGARAARDMFFPGKGTVSSLVPWCTFTDPELAHAGMTSAEAKAEFGDDVRIWRLGLEHSDRARADGTAEGAIIVVTGPKNRVLGAHILGAGAGELIHELALAIKDRMKINDLAGLIHVYPTLSTSIGQLAAEAAFEGAKKFSWLTRFAR